jgi:hypothetical protein
VGWCRKGGPLVKRIAVLGAGIALVALAVGVVTPAFGSGDRDHTIRVVSTATEQEFVDLGAKGFSLGDEFIFSANLHQHGKEVGHDGVVCTFTSADREEAECVATAWFSGGQITVQGLVAGESEFVLPVTGGSGKYEGAEGEIHIKEVSETKEILTFHIEV